MVFDLLMYMYMYMCVYVYVCTRTCVYMYVHVHAQYTYTYMYMYMYMYICGHCKCFPFLHVLFLSCSVLCNVTAHVHEHVVCVACAWHAIPTLPVIPAQPAHWVTEQHLGLRAIHDCGSRMYSCSL